MLELGGKTLESEGVGEQKDRPEGQESIGWSTDAGGRADVGRGAGRGGKESVVGIPPVKA